MVTELASGARILYYELEEGDLIEIVVDFQIASQLDRRKDSVKGWSEKGGRKKVTKGGRKKEVKKEEERKKESR